MQQRSVKVLTYSGYAFALAAYIFMGAVAAHPYDDAVIVQHAQLFYHLGTSPLFYLPQGIYWDVINIGSYFPEVLVHMLGFQNVITIHLATKLFLIVSAFLSAAYVEKIVRLVTDDERKGQIAFFIFILNPIIFYTTVIYGSSIIIAVLFITVSTYFILRGKGMLGAVFYGLSMGTFIYPLLGIPVVFRYVSLKSGRGNAFLFLVVSLVFGAVGQGPIFLFYLLHGSGLGGLPVGAGYVSTTQGFTPFSIFDIFNLYPVIRFPYVNYLFYSLSIFSSSIFFIIPREKVDETKLFAFLGLQGVIFSSLAAGGVLMSFPSSIVPFAILFAFSSKRNSILIPLLASFVTLSIAMETINNIGLPIYFLDMNHSVALHTITVTPTETQLSGFIFGLSIISMVPLFLLGKGRERNAARGHAAAIGVSTAMIVALLVLAVVVIAPVIGSVPATGYLQNPIGSSGIVEDESVSNGILHLNYTVYLLAMTPEQYYGKITMWLQEPVGYFTSGSYNYTSMLPIHGNITFPYEIAFPSSATKISVVSDSADVDMEISNSTSERVLTPAVSTYGRDTLLSYSVGTVEGGNYSITLNGSGAVGIYSSPGKFVIDNGEMDRGVAVDIVYSFSPLLTNGTVNGMRIQGGEAVTVPIEAYSYKLHFSFPGFYSTETSPYLVLEENYGGYSQVSLVEGGAAFIGIIAAYAAIFRLRKH